MKLLTIKPVQTKKAGQNLAKQILKKTLSKNAFIIGLKGDLGAGKTTFLQGFAKGLKIKENVLSPTFILMRKFQISKNIHNSKFKNFYHIDCYRFNSSKEVLTIGFKKIISQPENIIAIEWADKIKNLLPENIVWLEFKIKSKDRREIIIK